jgi:GNAT superfamily N-acetyltransferase
VRGDELPLLMDLTLRCWTGTVSGNSSLYRETPEYVAAQVSQPAGGALFLLLDNEPIGAGRFFRVPGPAGDARPWIEIKRMGILRQHRKAGHGPILVKALELAALAQIGPAGAQLAVRADQPRLVDYWNSLGYTLAGDVSLSTQNPLAPPPTTMRKWFKD